MPTLDDPLSPENKKTLADVSDAARIAGQRFASIASQQTASAAQATAKADALDAEAEAIETEASRYDDTLATSVSDQDAKAALLAKASPLRDEATAIRARAASYTAQATAATSSVARARVHQAKADQGTFLTTGADQVDVELRNVAGAERIAQLTAAGRTVTS